MESIPRPDPGTASSQQEEFEAVPWDALLRQPQPWTGRLPVLAAVAVGVLAVTVAVVRAYWPVPPTPDHVAPATVSNTAPLTSAAPVPPPPQAELPSEADLMAVDPSAFDAAARAYAEWYVSRLFTRDASTPPVDPHLNLTLVSGDERSYVESTHAVEIEALSASQRRVTVVARTLVAADPDGGFVRQPERTVEVVVRLGDSGLEVEELPRPGILPAPTAGLLQLSEVSRPDVVEAAHHHLERYGVPAEEPYHVGAASDGRIRVGWLVRDSSGVAWPHAVWFSADGALIP